MFRIFLIFLCSFNLTLQAQEKFTFNGYVRDSLTGETIIGSTVTVVGSNRSLLTNNYGFFSVTLPAGDYDVLFSHVSYETVSRRLSLRSDQTFTISLLPKSAALQEVVVFNKRKDGNVKNAQMGKLDLSMNQIRSIPAFLGEVDILKAIQLLPGVQSAGEGNAGFYVRGGGPDQNLILLDDATVYNTGHLFGFFSVFNGDAIKNVSLIKGGMPAQFGGRLSSVLDVAMKEGNINSFQGEGGIGLIASRFSLQGPLQKNKSSFIVSARRTYIDALVKPFISKNSGFYGSGYYFYDLNAKINYRFSDKDRLFLSGYFGRDVFNFNNAKRSFSTRVPWGNATGTLRWNHVFGPRAFANTTLVFNDYKFDFTAKQENFQVGLSSGIRDVGWKTDLDYYPNPQHKVKFGMAITHHTFVPNVVSGRQDSIVFQPNNAKAKYAFESALYIQDDWAIGERWKINYGIRLSRFTQIGPFTRYVKDANGNKIDSTVYGRGRSIQSYGGFEPRVTLRYGWNDNSSFKAAVTRNYQYIHLVTNAGSTLPTDLWVPSTYAVRPQESWLFALGYFRNFADNALETSWEVYYKDMQNQIEYKEGYTPGLSDPEEEFVFGKGWSYGSEWLINKVKGRLTGWVGYTLSWTKRQFPDLNGGAVYSARYDRRHDISVVANWDLDKRWKFGAVFVYGTGNAITLPERFYFVNGVLTQEFSRLNQYRMQAYHRMDVSATYTPKVKPGRKGGQSWVFSVYNLYSRQNPYFLYFDQSGQLSNGDLQVEARQVSLFPILPSVTWNFKF
ncbi:MAG: TonB-dependent receptor [Bacteroidota bacterium]